MQRDSDSPTPMLLNYERAMEVMERHQVDALVATRPENVYYLSDYGTQHLFHFAPFGVAAAVLPRDPEKQATLIVQGFELPHLASRHTWMPDLRVITGTGYDMAISETATLGTTERRLMEWAQEASRSGGIDRQRLIGRTLQDLGLAKGAVAFDEAEVMLELQTNELSSSRSVADLNLFREIRVIKTPVEIDLMKRSARALETALVGAANLIDEGVTAREVLNYFRSNMAQQGGFGSHMLGGGGEHPWLAHPDMSYRFKEGDVIYIDPAGHRDFYWADLGRVAVVGDVTPRLDEMFGHLKRCHEQLVPQIRAGSSAGRIVEEARRILSPHMGTAVLPLVHSIGLEHYDHPQTLGRFLADDFVIEEGMVLNFETLYFELGWGVLQLEDTYLVGTGEPERLQTLPMEPLVCPLGPDIRLSRRSSS